METVIDRKAAELRERVGMDEDTKALLSEIDMRVQTEGITLATLIREGSTVSKQAYAWGDGETACALSAAVISARARGLL